MKMKKTLTLAIASALVVPAAAFAETANVEVYGTLLPFLENVKDSGATTGAPTDKPNQVGTAAYTGANDPARNRITVGTSNIGFRGAHDIGGDTKFVWQIESGVPVDGSAGPNTLASRNSRVGVASSWGEVFYGVWDTPYKFTTLQVNPLPAGYVFDYNLILGNPGFNVPGTTTQAGRIAGKADAAFDRRQGNSIQYWTPKFGGFSGRIAYSVDEGKSADNVTPQIAPDIWSLSLQYDAGPMSLRYAYEQHNDYFGLSQLGGTNPSATNTSSKDTGHKLTGIFTFGNTRLAAAIEQLKWTNDDSTAAAVKEYDRTAYYVLVEQKLGAHKLWLSYGQGDDGSCEVVGGGNCSTNGLGANQWVLGYMYDWRKEAKIFAGYYKVTNDDSGTYTSFPTPSGSAIAPGADTQGFGLGVLVTF